MALSRPARYDSSQTQFSAHLRGGVRAEARVRARQRNFLAAGAVLFAAYYVLFFVAGIYTSASLAIGLGMAAGLGVAAALTSRLRQKGLRNQSIGIAALLAVGATSSAVFSDGSQCVGFHTLWALPLIYGLFVQDQWEGNVAVAVLSLGGGLFVLLGEGESASRIAQWATLSVAAGLFAYVQQAATHREHALSLAEHDDAQSRLATADRMASIGLLATGVAHEINNPLSFIATNVQWVASELVGREPTATSGADIKQALADAQTGCDRVTTIVKALGRLSREEGSVSGTFDVNRALEDVIRLSRRDLERTALLKFDPAQLSPIPGDEARLGQVFLNLLVNAAHAVEDRPDGPRTISVRTFARGSDKIVVEVVDTGCGIRREKIRQIFDPFYTTKVGGRGTGLGLPLCAEIVQQHYGSIEVESTHGEGSAFRVVLPASDREDAGLAS